MAEPSSDADLIARLQAGETAAFDQAYETWRPRVYGFLVRLTGRRDLAEDLLQETWLRLARHSHRLREDTRLGPWLFTVARNLHTSHRRWSLADLVRRERVDPPAEPASPFEQTAAAQTRRRLEEALAALPLPYREVLLLIAVERLEHDDAAAVLGLSAVALRKRLSRARGLLQAELD
ncbi:MAG TPA: RNA polymerase sigma factor, partial [Kofleriaceae bacterium]|nr:RNA polymerase sigma factor [Kofleriaceae bacterium]